MALLFLTIAVFLDLICLGASDDNQCVFNDNAGSSHTLDLSSLMNQNITIQDEFNQDFVYEYSICSNNFKCTGWNETKTGMFLQTYIHVNNSCSIIAEFDVNVKPIYNPDLKMWTFFYKNGHNCASKGIPRELQLEFICNDDLNHPIEIISVSEPATCIYSATILTGFACVDHRDDDASTIALSFGSIVLIIFVVCFMVYCGIGCLVGKCQAIPHQGFWLDLPNYVSAGCKETRDIVCRC
eukprot:116264_1